MAHLALALRLGREHARLRREPVVAGRAVPRRRRRAPGDRRSRWPRPATSAAASSPSGAARADASAALSSPTGLVWRLTRGAVIGWAVGGLLVGLLVDVARVDRAGGRRREPRGRERPAADRGRAATSSRRAVTTFFTMVGILAACCAVQTVVPRPAGGDARHGRAAARHARRPGALARGLPRRRPRSRSCSSSRRRGRGRRDRHRLAGRRLDLMRDVARDRRGQVAAASVFLGLTALVFVLAPAATIAVGLDARRPRHDARPVRSAVRVPGLAGAPLAHRRRAARWTATTVDVRGLWWLLLADRRRRRGIPRAHAPARAGSGRIVIEGAM